MLRQIWGHRAAPLEAPAALAFVPLSLIHSLPGAVVLALCWPEILPGRHLEVLNAEMDKVQRQWRS